MPFLKEDDGLPQSDGPFQTAEATGKKKKIPLETAYSTEDDELAEMADAASKEKPKAKVDVPVAEAAGEVPEGIVKAYPIPKPRPKPIEVLMLAAVNMDIPADATFQPAAAPAPSFDGKSKASPVADTNMGVVISAETMRDVSSDEQISNTDAKASFAAQLRDGTAEDVPMIKPITTASAAGQDIFWFQQIIFNSDAAVRRDGAPQPFGELLAGLLPGIEEAEAAPTDDMPKLAVAGTPEVAVGKGDMLVVNREGKGSLMMDAPAVAGQDPETRPDQSVDTKRSICYCIEAASGRLFRFAGDHAQRGKVEIEHRLLFFALGGFLLAQRNHLAQDLGVEAVGLGFGIDFLDVAGDRLLLLLEPFDALDQRTKLSLRESGLGAWHRELRD